MRLNDVPAVFESVIGRGCITVQHFSALWRRTFGLQDRWGLWTSSGPRALHLWDRGWENARCLCPCAESLSLLTLRGRWKGFAALLLWSLMRVYYPPCVGVVCCWLPLWVSPMAEMLSVAVKYILFLCFFKNVTALRSCNMTGCPNMINEMCFASFSMITIWDNLRDSNVPLVFWFPARMVLLFFFLL